MGDGAGLSCPVAVPIYTGNITIYASIPDELPCRKNSLLGAKNSLRRAKKIPACRAKIPCLGQGKRRRNERFQGFASDQAGVNAKFSLLAGNSPTASAAAVIRPTPAPARAKSAPA
jgi:hypothetical protein